MNNSEDMVLNSTNIGGNCPESPLGRDDIVAALTAHDFEPYRAWADRIRQENCGDTVHIRAILEYSNYCRRRCSYCGLNCTNTKLERYRLPDKEMVDTARRAAEVGYKTIVLQGGEDNYFSPQRLASIVHEIVKCGITVTVSAGEMTYAELALIRSAGATRYLLKHETASEEIYAKLHGDYPLQRRIECLRDIKKLGYETGSGFMIGLPGQTAEIIADDILLLRELGCDMAGIGPFIPHEDTPLRGLPAGSVDLTKRAVAMARILMPNILLPATTSLHVLGGEDGDNVFGYGANVIMRKVTPTEARRLYEIYPSDKRATDIAAERKELEDFILTMGRNPL